MKSNLISVAVTTHKRPDYLKDCLDSILNQTLLPNELVISEDGEDFNTRGLINQYIIDFPQVNIHHIVNKIPLGQLANRQQAIKATTGEYVAMLDDDDIWNDRFLETTYGALSTKDCGFCSSNHLFMDHKKNVLHQQSYDFADYCGRSSMNEDVYSDVFVRTLTNKACIFSLQFTLFRREALESVGFFQNFGGLIPDYCLMLALGSKRLNAYFIPEFLGMCRVHEGQQTNKRLENSISKVEGISGIIDKYGEELSKHELSILKSKYRELVIECSIAFAHEKKRTKSLKNSLNLYRFGFGLPSPKRILIWLLLLGGVKRKYG